MYFIDRTFRFIAAASLSMFAVIAVGMSAANAQQPAPPSVKAFVADPAQFLKQYPNGGQVLTNAVEQLALTDPSTFKTLIGLLGSANDLQKTAIGSGLAQAAKIEVLTDQNLAAEWQQQIAAVNDPSFKTAATNAFGDVQIGGVGGGPTGGGGGGQTSPLSQGASGPTPFQNFGARGTNTSSFTFSSSTVAASSLSFSSSPSSSVSP